MVCEQYAKQFGMEEFLHPINYREKHWQDEEEMRWGRGICVFSYPPGIISKYNRLVNLLILEIKSQSVNFHSPCNFFGIIC